ncbi:MAG TPA: hypothetical protein VF398_02780 [bacterium]
MTQDSSSSDLTRIAREQGLVPLLRGVLRHMDAVATGAIGTEKLQLLMIPGRLVQAVRNKTFVEQLAGEFEELLKKGRVRKDFEHSEECQASLQQLLAALEEPPVDDMKFRALKSIFIATATTGTTKDVPPQLILNIARTLSSGELIVLATAFRIVRDDPGLGEKLHGVADAWVAQIARVSGIGLTGLVEHYESLLASKNLVNHRHQSDRSGLKMGKHFGLTDFGLRLCELMQRGDDEIATLNS